ncbi:hypothetical protein GHT09_014255 [Marmota monax]|uniref:VWFD domain-containing protein n=1 Tax=Marmota monax TaxID=9995 RepID=A0A834PKW4_MARMO|nr:hypothetical protein GHT09_014255 [Marmota monax]
MGSEAETPLAEGEVGARQVAITVDRAAHPGPVAGDGLLHTAPPLGAAWCCGGAHGGYGHEAGRMGLRESQTAWWPFPVPMRTSGTVPLGTEGRAHPRDQTLQLPLLLQKGESWAMPNCTQATCEGSSIISLRPRKCPEVKEPTCANGYPALKVADQDGCCQHYQCQCVCSGWGDPHYITFDGTYYTFLDNCTYVLVQQVVPVYGHFRVLINNDFCDPKDQLSCPQAIIVEYHQDRVVLTRTSVGGVMTNQIIFNNKVVSPGFQSNGIAVSRVGIKMYVTIREIGVQVMFSGLIFSVEVPFSTFANNTEGQCGTCTNDKRDECRLPGGTVAPSCSAMSGHWKVDVPGQPHCHGPTPTPPSTTPQTTPVQCPPSPLCELILSNQAGQPPRAFAVRCRECRPWSPPQHLVMGSLVERHLQEGGGSPTPSLVRAELRKATVLTWCSLGRPVSGRPRCGLVAHTTSAPSACRVFQPCHHVISPQSFYEGCVFDYCHMTPLDVVCSGLQLYAALCASEGVCIDWRGHTNHACPFTCSAGKVYLPCGPSSLPYCYGKDSTSSLALPEAGPITEGCFCPENTMLFSSDAQVCVPANCSWCLGPHGEPVEVSVDGWPDPEPQEAEAGGPEEGQGDWPVARQEEEAPLLKAPAWPCHPTKPFPPHLQPSWGLQYQCQPELLSLLSAAPGVPRGPHLVSQPGPRLTCGRLTQASSTAGPHHQHRLPGVHLQGQLPEHDLPQEALSPAPRLPLARLSACAHCPKGWPVLSPVRLRPSGDPSRGVGRVGSASSPGSPGEQALRLVGTACNTSYCPEPQHCPKGSRLVLTHEEGACCPSQICRLQPVYLLDRRNRLQCQRDRLPGKARPAFGHPTATGTGSPTPGLPDGPSG